MKKSEKRKVGDKYEAVTAKWLKENGYKILERNWTAPPHEIDIIAMKGKTVAFVEVKSGNERFFESPESRIDLDKMRFIVSAAKKYLRHLQSRDIDIEEFDYRFDASAITFDGAENITEFKYYENYFEVGESFPN